MFYVWFKRYVNLNSQTQTQLKVFSENFFEFLTDFGYKNTTTTKIKDALVFLAPLILEKNVQLKVQETAYKF